MRPRSKAEPGSNGSYFFPGSAPSERGKREKMSYDGSLKFDTSIDASGFQKGVNGLFASSKKLAAAAGKALAGIATACISVGALSVNAGKEVEEAATKASTLFGDVAVDTDHLRDAMMDLSNASGKTASELYESLYQAMSAGIPVTEDMSEAINLVSTASKLSVAGFTDSATAVDALMTAINAYKLDASEAASVSDKLLMVQNRGVTTVDQLSQSMGKAIATASNYGVNLDNLSSAYISITKNGISTAEGTTYLNSMIKELGKSNSSVAGILKEKTGKTFGELMQSGSSLADVLQIVMDNCNGNSEAFSNLWGSQEGAMAASAILTQGVKTFNTNLQDLHSAAGVTEESFNSMSDTLDFRIAQMKQGLNNLGVSIYQGLSEPATNAAASLGGMITKMQQAYDTDGFSGLASAAGTALAEMATSAASMVPEMISIGSEAIGAFCSTLISSKELKTAAVSIIKAVYDGLKTNFPKVVTAGIEIINSLAESIQSSLPGLIPVAMEAILNFSSYLRENVGSIVDAGLNLIMGLADSLITNIPVLIATVPTIVTNIAGCINDNAPKVLLAGVQLIGKLALGLIQAIPTLIANVPKIIQAIVAVWSAFNWINLGKQVITFISNGLKSLTSAIPNALKNIGNKAVDLFKGINWSNLGSQVINFIVRGVQSLVSAIPNALKAIGSRAMSAFKGINWGSVGMGIVKGIAAGISGGASAIVNAARNAATNALKKAKEFLGIHSPSRVFRDEVGIMIPAGIGAGFERGIPSLVKDMEEGIGSMVARMQLSVLETRASFRPAGVTEQIVRDSLFSNLSDQLAGLSGESGDVINNINIYQPVKSPSEVARAIRLEQQYGLAGD